MSRNTDSKIRDAFSAVTPDIKALVLNDCKNDNGKVISMTEIKKKRSIWPIIAAAAAAVLLLAALPFVIKNVSGPAPKAAASVMIDVNPGVELKVGSDNRVLEAIPRNSDGAILLEDMDLTGSEIKVAVNAILGSLLRRGYLNELANSILISVESENGAGDELLSLLQADVLEVMSGSGIGCSVLGQTIAEDAGVAALADEYGITLGKAQLINRLVGAQPNYEFSSLAALSINELSLLSSKGNVGGVIAEGSASELAYIGEAAALEAALAHAGVSEADAKRVSIELDCEHGLMVYEVEFTANGFEYDYEINAVTGEVVDYEREAEDITTTEAPTNPTDKPTPRPTATPAPSQSSDLIGKKAAKRIAFKHAGVSESNVYDLEVELDRDHGTAKYEIEFKCGGYEYDYEIDALTGNILESGREAIHGSSTPKPTAKPTEKPTAKPTQQPSGSGYIGRAAAISIALQDAGLEMSEVSCIEAELERDDGKVFYDVEFRAGGWEYDYEIDAKTGRVLDSSREKVSSGSSEPPQTIAFIGEERAWEIVLAKAGVSMSEISDKDIEFEYENGVHFYEIEFTHGAYEYEAKVNAVTGAIMQFSRELED
jgi:uncharacterized membrane protein YkoI